MTKNLTSKIGYALDMLSKANDAMIECIIQAVNENDVTYEETIDDSCGYTELRFVEYNEDGDLCVKDENGNELFLVEDLSADELYDICIKIA